MLGTLLIAVVGTGAGVALGLSAMISNDIYKVYVNKNATDKQNLTVARLVIVLILVVAALFTMGNMGSLILGWSFMSMGLRGAVAFGPLCTALFLPGRIPGKWALSAMIIGPVLVLVGKFILPASIDPLFLGLAGSILVLVAGYMTSRRNRPDASLSHDAP